MNLQIFHIEDFCKMLEITVLIGTKLLERVELS